MKDIEFIERLERDFRKCQIDPWLDDIELRHGKPWLDAIFEDGIPNCDAVLVYFTENSLASKVVKKELDAGVLAQLDDGSVALLPYVDQASLRDDLRADIRTLQVPEWNNENFAEILARCVAEIWRSFHERRIEQAIASEKVKRLEAEREVENLKDLLGEEDLRIFGRTFEEILSILENSQLLRSFLLVVDTVDQMETVIYPDEGEREEVERLISLGLLKRKGNTGRNSKHLAIDLTPEGRRFATENAFTRLAKGEPRTPSNASDE